MIVNIQVETSNKKNDANVTSNIKNSINYAPQFKPSNDYVYRIEVDVLSEAESIQYFELPIIEDLENNEVSISLESEFSNFINLIYNDQTLSYNIEIDKSKIR